MHITGIVAEYNPFHNGHLYHLQETKRRSGADFVIAVMSGNFSQRGTPTITDKFTRTEMALRNGVDLVLELPVPFATASAERFSEAAIALLGKTGIVDSICFGSEHGSISLLSEVADLLLNNTSDFSSKLQAYLKIEGSFPRARELALLDLLQENTSHNHTLDKLKETLQSPNNILGIEYIKAIKKIDFPLTPLTIKRESAAFHDTDIYSSIASATAIRTHALKGDIKPIAECMPKEAFDLLSPHLDDIPLYNNLSQFLQYKLIFSKKEDLYSLWDVPEALIRSIINASTTHYSLSDFVNTITSKTYTRATVQRVLLRIILDLKSKDVQLLEEKTWIPYIRVLGCKKESTKLLGALIEHASVPVITNLSKSYSNLDSISQMLLDYELRATGLYYSLLHKPECYKEDFTKAFIKI